MLIRDHDLQFGGHRYAILLAMLLFAVVFRSLAAGVERMGLPHDVVGTILVLAIFHVVFAPGALRHAMGLVLGAILAVGWGRLLVAESADRWPWLAFQGLSAVFYWVAVGTILSNLFRAPTSGAENVRGAICGYLIAGSAWASVNALAWQLVPAAFGIDARIVPLLADWNGSSAIFNYYSYAQMLTIGYAEVTPVRAPATTLSLLAALFGLFYTAVVVSQLVTMAQSRGGAAGDR